jgi:hypothetical protein
MITTRLQQDYNKITARLQKDYNKICKQQLDLFSLVSINWRTRIQNSKSLPEVRLNYGKL